MEVLILPGPKYGQYSNRDIQVIAFQGLRHTREARLCAVKTHGIAEGNRFGLDIQCGTKSVIADLSANYIPWLGLSTRPCYAGVPSGFRYFGESTRVVRNLGSMKGRPMRRAWARTMENTPR